MAFNKFQTAQPQKSGKYIQPNDSSDDEVDSPNDEKKNAVRYHNIPIVSGSNLMIKSKNGSTQNLMNFNKMKYMTIQQTH